MRIETTSKSSWRGALLVAGLLASVLFVPSPLVAQAEPAAEAPATGETPAEAVPSTDFQTIDDLLLQDEEVRSDPDTYSYDPGNRRDPFRSLLVTPPGERDSERPEGVPGLLIDEIEIEGVFILEDGPVVQVISSDKETSYLLRPGDQLWDGEVVSIGLDEVVFKQRIEDPTALKPFREVVKKLSS